MCRLRQIALGLALAAILTPALVPAAEHDEAVKKDLFAVISLQGQPCGKVVTFQRLAKEDYIATCQTGDRYRVNLTVEGRVKVERQ